MILRSRWPAARIKKIHLENASRLPGIKAAVAIRKGERLVRYYGEELAAVAGITKQACLDALRLIEVEATPLPFVVKEEEVDPILRPVAVKVKLWRSWVRNM